MFFPSAQTAESGYSIPDAVIELKPNRRTFMIEVSNYGMWPCIMHEGVVLGDLQYCERVSSDLSVVKSGTWSTVNVVAADPSGILPPSEHRKQV